MSKKSITVDGVEYVPASDNQPAEEYKEMKYVIIRTYSAGVHAGYLKSRKGKECELVNARRIWYWDGAASLSQLAMEGANKPNNCKFAMPVDSIELTEVVEVIPCRKKAQDNILNMPEWKK